MDKKLVIFTAASNDYLVYLERFLASFHINLPNALIHAYLINVDEEKDIYLKTLNNNIIIEHSFLDFKSLADQRGYCANLRASIFPILMAEYDCPVVWIDVDSMIIGNGDELIKYAHEYDLSVDYTKEHKTLTANEKKTGKLPKGAIWHTILWSI